MLTGFVLLSNIWVATIFLSGLKQYRAIVALYALWWKHLTLFRGDGLAAWIGLLVVVQNIFTSLFNSHLFDFHEGWMYVLGVGVAGGMVLGQGAMPGRRARIGPEAAAQQG